MIEDGGVAHEAQKRGDWERFASALFQMGYDFATLRTLGANKKVIRLGTVQSSGLESARTRSANSRKQRKIREHALWIAEARKIWKVAPKLPVRACALRIIAREIKPLRKSERTVRNAIRPYAPKKDGSVK